MKTRTHRSASTFAGSQFATFVQPSAPLRLLMLSICLVVLASVPVVAGQPNGIQDVGLSAAQISVVPMADVTVPLTITDTTGLGIIAYQFNMTYDPAVLQINSVPIVAEGTLSESMSFAVNPNVPGILRVAVYGAYPLVGAGVLLKLRFTAIGPIGSTTDLIWQDVLLNEDVPGVTPINGSVTIIAPVVNEVSLSGNIRRYRGGPLPFARVVLTGTDGIYRTVQADAFGRYEFANLTTNSTYTVTGIARGLSFLPQIVDVANTLVVVDLVSNPRDAIMARPLEQ